MNNENPEAAEPGCVVRRRARGGYVAYTTTSPRVGVLAEDEPEARDLLASAVSAWRRLAETDELSLHGVNRESVV